MIAQKFVFNETQEDRDFTEAVKYGQDYVVTLDNYRKARLSDLAQKKQYRVVQVQTERLKRSCSQQPNQLEYWLSCSPQYVEAQQILDLLAEPVLLEVLVVKPTLAAEAALGTIAEPVAEVHKRPLPEIALHLIYSGRPLSRQEAKEIALAEGYSSGDALYNSFCKYSHYTNRTGFNYEGAEKKGRHMIKRISNVLPRLSGEQRKFAEKEIFTIEKYIS